MLEEYGIVISMSRPGYPYDNSCMESFFTMLKKEVSTGKNMLQWKKLKKTFSRMWSYFTIENACIRS
ncbi:MAG: hypothetical protein VB064_00930 [Oscillospiraceae bacterium]|nr:hypothetical protein [Oscillospiraceae bacterium]